MTEQEKLRKLWIMSNDFALDNDERKVIAWAYQGMKELAELKVAKAWQNPYSEAISVLEARARAFEGGYG